MNETNSQGDKSIYEIGYHIVPTTDESEISAYASKLKSLIEEEGGVVFSEETPKIMTIAYDISKNINFKKQKFNRTYFGWIKFEADRTQTASIKDRIKNFTEILRFLIIKTVRESTMHTLKIPMFKKENNKKEKKYSEKPKISEAEIDKSIDELVIS